MFGYLPRSTFVKMASTSANKTLCVCAEQPLNRVFMFFVGDHLDCHLSLVRGGSAHCNFCHDWCYVNKYMNTHTRRTKINKPVQIATMTLVITTTCYFLIQTCFQIILVFIIVFCSVCFQLCQMSFNICSSPPQCKSCWTILISSLV